jgi:NADPH:quinone reductase-like Zn-dependent oxidoreductase
MKTWLYPQLGLDNLQLADHPQPPPCPREVTVKFHAASVNYRDLLFARGLYNPHPNLPAVPLSDGAGEIIAVGPEVSRWKIGDRVCPIFLQQWLTGPRSAAVSRSALGAGDLDGVLRETANFHEDGLVAIPPHLSYEEAATLPCAAVTAWHALKHVGQFVPGETVLILGTGGVSIFALQFAKALGVRVIITSGTDEKLSRARRLGADETINYRTTPDWDKEVLRLTNNIGADRVIEVGGAGTLPRSVNATRIEGTIPLIGVLASGAGLDPMRVLMKSIRLQGLLVGSRHMFEEMNEVITHHRLTPIISRTFPFAEAREAITVLAQGEHFGKIVIRF